MTRLLSARMTCYVELRIFTLIYPIHPAVIRRLMSIETNKENDQHTDFHGAAIIDEDGKEVPITEDMVQEACQEADIIESDENTRQTEK